MKITIITAVFNSEKTVAEAIASVAAQTYTHVEHLIVEGKSTDGSLAEIERVAHSNMRIISEPDRGIYDALNKGIQQSTGEVIGVVHGDDFFADNEVLGRIARAFSDPGVEAVYSDLDYVSRGDRSRVVRHWSSGQFSRWRLKFGWMPPHPTLYVRRSVYERYGAFDTRYRIAADYDFILRYFSKAVTQPIYIREVTYKMRIGGVSNKDLGKIILKMREDYKAIRENRVGGLVTLFFKNVLKAAQIRLQ